MDQVIPQSDAKFCDLSNMKKTAVRNVDVQSTIKLTTAHNNSDRHSHKNEDFEEKHNQLSSVNLNSVKSCCL